MMHEYSNGELLANAAFMSTKGHIASKHHAALTGSETAERRCGMLVISGNRQINGNSNLEINATGDAKFTFFTFFRFGYGGLELFAVHCNKLGLQNNTSVCVCVCVCVCVTVFHLILTLCYLCIQLGYSEAGIYQESEQNQKEFS